MMNYKLRLSITYQSHTSVISLHYPGQNDRGRRQKHVMQHVLTSVPHIAGGKRDIYKHELHLKVGFENMYLSLVKEFAKGI